MPVAVPYIKREPYLTSVFENAFSGMLIIDYAGLICDINHTAANLLYYHPEELEGREFSSLIDSKDSIRFEMYLSQFRSNRFPAKLELCLMSKKQTLVLVDMEFTISILEGELFFIGFFREISKGNELKLELEDQKEINTRTVEKLEKEKELSDLKGRFVSMASHEFRTPLAGILSSVQLSKRYLQMEGDQWTEFAIRDKIETHFRKIEESVANLTLILDDFLSLGRIEEKNLNFKCTWFNLTKFIETMRHELIPLCKAGQDIEYKHQGEKEMVYLDRHILRNILNNLVSNAIKYSGKNRIISIITRIDSTDITIEVWDEGIGIPESEQKNIFRRFFRAANALNYQGTGIGLHIVKNYAKVLNGDITFQSRLNQGSRFIITFPISLNYSDEKNFID